MSEPIKIVISAQTAEAAMALQAFVAQTNNGLRSIAQEAAETGKHMGGMMYQFRSAMDAVRFAAMDGGPRAAFYAVDEALRAVVASGLKLSTVVPPLAAVAAVVGVAALGWRNFTADERQAAEQAKALGDALEKIPDQLKAIETARKAGVISAATAQKYQDYLSGARPLYNNHGDITEQGSLFPTDYGSGAKLPLATMAERQQYVAQQQEQDQLTHGGKDDPRIAAGAKLQALEREAQLEAIINDAERKKLKTADEYLEKREEIQAALAGKGELATDADRAFTNKALADNRAAQDAALAKIDKDAQDKRDKQAEDDARKAAEAEAAVKEFYANAAKDALKKTEEQITAEQDQAGNQRGALIQQEYNSRMQTAKDALAIGGITEEEYSHLMEEAAHKRTEAEREYNAQLEQTAQLKKEIAQADAESQLRVIDRNPLLTNQQKEQQSLPLWQKELSGNQADVAAQQGIMNANPADSQAGLEAHAKKNELLAQQADLQEKINAAQNADNISYQMDVEITKLRNVGTVAQQTAAAFGSAWTTAVNSISTNISKVIQGTESWRKAMVNIYNTILNEVINSFVHMAVQWALQHTLMSAISSLFQTQQIASATSGEAASTANTEAGAISRIGAHASVAAAGAASSQASIPYVGPVLAVVAMAAILAVVLALAHGFAEGGPVVGPGSGTSDSVLARLSHGEFVVRADAVRQIGIDNLHAINSGNYRSGSGAGAGGAGRAAQNNVSVHTWMDSRAMADALERDAAHEKYVVDVMRRNIHRFR